jgi:hypothetical protein
MVVKQDLAVIDSYFPFLSVKINEDLKRYLTVSRIMIFGDLEMGELNGSDDRGIKIIDFPNQIFFEWILDLDDYVEYMKNYDIEVKEAFRKVRDNQRDIGTKGLWVVN